MKKINKTGTVVGSQKTIKDKSANLLQRSKTKVQDLTNQQNFILKRDHSQASSGIERINSKLDPKQKIKTWSQQKKKKELPDQEIDIDLTLSNHSYMDELDEYDHLQSNTVQATNNRSSRGRTLTNKLSSQRSRQFDNFQQLFKQDSILSQSDKIQDDESEPSSDYSEEEIIFGQEQMDKLQKQYEKRYERNPHSDFYSLQLLHVSDWDEIMQDFKLYQDSGPLLKTRKFVVLIYSSLSLFFQQIIASQVFVYLMLAIISMNIVVFSFENYGDNYSLNQAFYDYVTKLFFLLYVVEHFMKIFGLGILGFMNDFWNQYDLINIILYGLYIYYPQLLKYDFSPFRAMRILIFLGKISTKLGIMLLAISESLKFLIEASLIVMLFCIFFANVGVHLFRGQMYNHCMHEASGIHSLFYQLCGFRPCPADYVCYRAMNNDEQPSNYDHFFYAFAQTLRVISCDDWTRIMYSTMDTFSPYIFIYYVLSIFIGGYFAFNLVLAVLRTYYGLIVLQYQDLPDDLIQIGAVQQKSINLRFLKHIGLYNTVKTLQQFRLQQHSPQAKHSITNQLSLHQQMGAIHDNIIPEQTIPALDVHDTTPILQSRGAVSTFKSVAQIAGINRILNKAKVIKNRKKLRLLLSARQKRLQEQKLREESGIEDTVKDNVLEAIKNWTVKRCLLPKRKMNLEKKIINQKIENDNKGKQILFILQNNDILAWKVQYIPNNIFVSNSEEDVLCQNSKQQNKKDMDIENQLIIIKQSNPRMIYIPVTKRNNTMHKDQDIRPHNLSILHQRSLLLERSGLRLPIMMSNRLKVNIFRNPNMRASMYRVKQRTNNMNKLKQTVTVNKKMNRFELPEYQEGQSYILLNGVKWNFKAMKMLFERNIPLEVDDLIENYDDRYIQLRSWEVSNNLIKKHNYSGYDVLKHYRTNQDFNIMKSLNNQAVIIWMVGLVGLGKVFQKYIIATLSYKEVTLIFDLITALNILILCMDGYADSAKLEFANNIFSYLLLLEIVLKMISQGLRRYSRNPTNIFEFFIVSVCVAEVYLSYQSANIGSWLNDERSLMRACKTLMCYRIVRYSPYAVRIMKIAAEIIPSYLNLTFLMVYIILIFAIIGMEFFSQAWDENTILGQLHTFKSVIKSWMTTFDVSTNDDWYGMLRLCTGSPVTEQWISLLYAFLVVFVIDYMLWGLVLAVLLDAFSKQYRQTEDDDIDQSEDLQELVGLDKIGDQSNEVTLKSVEGSEQQLQIKEDEDRKRQQSIFQSQISRFSSAQIDSSSMQQSISNSYCREILCENSLYIFHYDNLFRRACNRINSSWMAKRTLDLTILFSVFLLIVDSYQVEHSIKTQQYQDGLFPLMLFVSHIITCVFYGVRIIANGFCMDDGSFCTNVWSALDILYLMGYFISYWSNQPVISLVQYMIFLRPMTILNMFRTLDGIKQALALSLREILNLTAVLAVVWIIFAIFAINLYQGKMGYCTLPNNFSVGKEQVKTMIILKCLSQGDKWYIYKHNFENLGEAMPTLFVVATLDQWDEILQTCFNSDYENIGPSPFNNQITSYVFFFLFVFIGSQFFMGFFTGVLFSGFSKYTKQLENKALTQDQQQFQKIANIILDETPKYSNAPTSFIRRLAVNIIKNKIYNIIFICALLSNLIILSCLYQDASHEFLTNWNTLYQAWSLFFVLDTTFKLLGFGVVRYFGTTWRLIEFFVSAAAITDLVLDYYVGWYQLYLYAREDDPRFIFLRLFFILRDTRIILIIQEFKGLQRLLRVIDFCLKFLFQILFIYGTTLSAYALLGVQLFGNLNGGNTMDGQYCNFHNFGNAFLVLFKCSTVDNWREIMTDCTHYNPNCATNPTQCGTNLSYPFFISFIIFSYYVLLNLFVLTLVDQFENFFQSQTSVIQTYIENIDHFCNVWCRYSYEYRGVKMHTKFLGRFLLELGEPLGSIAGDNIWDIAKSASNYRIRADVNGYVLFNEVLYETVRYAFKQQVFKTGFQVGIQQMKLFDRNLRFSLNQRSNNLQKSEFNMNSTEKSTANFNILQEYLNVLIVFKTLEVYSQKLYNQAGDCVKQPYTYSESMDASENSLKKITEEDKEVDHFISLEDLDKDGSKASIPNIYQQISQCQITKTLPTEHQQKIIFQPVNDSKTSREKNYYLKGHISTMNHKGSNKMAPKLFRVKSGGAELFNTPKGTQSDNLINFPERFEDQ